MSASFSEHHLVVGRANDHGLAVLLLRQPEGWALPRVELLEQRAADCARINRAAGNLLGVSVSILRCLVDDPSGNVRQQVHDLEVHAAEWAPPADAAWFTRSQLDGAPLVRTDQRAILDLWFRKRSEPPPAGCDWVRPGWRAEAIGWAEGELARLRLPSIDRIEQVRVWEFSHVLRLHTAAGEVYLKARPTSGMSEPPLTQYLATQFRAWMPTVLGIEPDRRWLLMRATEGPALMDTGDLARWEQAAETCARIQIDCVGRTPELVALGCPVRPLHRLEAEIPPLLDDVGALQPADALSLTDADLEEARRLSSKLQALCRELAALGVPPSLEHGDLWGENVVAGARECVFIDWEDASVSVPFLSPFLLLASLEYTEALAALPDARARIRAAYLKPWQRWATAEGWPAGRLEQAFDLAQRLAGVHYAVQFRRFTVPLIETSWEVRAFAPLFLRATLRMMREADGAAGA